MELAHIAQESGAAAVAVHGRTREQYYAGKADWDCIAQVKQAVSIPVMGNGDVNGPEAAERMRKETGCDAVLVGRAARGNPWIFRQIIHYLETGELLSKPPIEEVRAMMLRHSARLRERINEMETMEELEALFLA